MEAIKQHQLTPVSWDLHLHGLPHVTVFPLHSQRHGFVTAQPCSWLRAPSSTLWLQMWVTGKQDTMVSLHGIVVIRIQASCGSPSTTMVCVCVCVRCNTHLSEVHLRNVRQLNPERELDMLQHHIENIKRERKLNSDQRVCKNIHVLPD